MRARAVLGIGAVIAAVAAGIPVSQPSLSLAASTHQVAVHANAAALTGHGELAVISTHRLLLIGGPHRQATPVALSGRAIDPIWSHDGRWLAVRVSPAPPKGDPYAYEPAVLWLVTARGHVVRALTPARRQVVSAAWSPKADVLAVATETKRGGHHDATAAIVSRDGSSRTLAAVDDVAGVAWSPNGHQVAISANQFAKSGYVSRLRTYPAAGGAGRTVTTSKGNVLDLAGWWPDGASVLAWLDYQGSGSLAADGLPLLDVPLATGKKHQIAKTMLTYPSWIAESTATDRIAIIEGGDRELTLSHKTLATCTPTHCVKVAQPKRQVSFDPGWSSSGRLSVVRDRAIKPHQFGTPYIDRVDRSGGVRFVSDSTATAVPGLSANATAPLWGRDGSLLAVRGHDVVLLAAGASKSRLVIGPLHVGISQSYYGHQPWGDFIAWTDAVPGGLAGTG